MHAAGEREVGLAAAQALAGQVDGRERGRLAGVDGEAGSGEAECVGDPVGDDAPVQTGRGVLADGVRAVALGEAGVVVCHGADEHAGAGAAEGRRDGARALQGLPGEFQHQPLLRVHGGGLAGADAEERRVEPVDVVEEGALAGGGPCPGAVVQLGAVGGEAGDGVAAVAQHLPERFRGVGRRETARGCHHGDGRGAVGSCEVLGHRFRHGPTPIRRARRGARMTVPGAVVVMLGSGAKAGLTVI